MKGEYKMDLAEMRLDCAVKQKKGLHFILASVYYLECNIFCSFDFIAYII